MYTNKRTLQRSIKYIFCFFLALNSFVSKAQEDALDTLAIEVEEDAIMPRQRKFYQFTPRLSFTVPHPMGNAAFKKTFVGIYEANAGLNLMFYRGFYAGATFKNGLLKVTEKKIRDYNAGMTVNSAAAKVGVDFYLNEKNTVMVSAAVSAGQNSTRFTSLVCKDPGGSPAITSYKSFYYEPEATLFLFVEENFALGITSTYSVIKRTFDPYELCFDDWAAYGKENSGPTRYISFGFGFYYGFSMRKSN